MAKKSKIKAKQHKFRNKLLLNRWLISLFGIDTLTYHKKYDGGTLPFHKLASPIKDPRLEGIDKNGLHTFFDVFVNSELFFDYKSNISKEQLIIYEQNIVNHTNSINARRERPIVWKYFQWLTLIFIEIYLDRYFSSKTTLMSELNEYVDKFNNEWDVYKDIDHFTEDDLNKLCLQNATGSGKTLLMHINLLQFRHYAKQTSLGREISRVILLTPNERLSEQHLAELYESGFDFAQRMQTKQPASINMIEVLEITKLADQEGPNTIAARSLGDQNLLLVDEGHRGMSGKEEGAWFSRRSELCAKGFTFEYSATFEQAVAASKNQILEDTYAKTVIFDYSYRWFYEDGFGKDYQILNLPKTYSEVRNAYLTACLLKFYQQLRIYEEDRKGFIPFNMEKPLWIFVGSTVSKAKGGTKDDMIVATDVAQIIHFIASFLSQPQMFIPIIRAIIFEGGSSTGLLDDNGSDIFAGSFGFLAKKMAFGQNEEALYQDILNKLFHSTAGGQLLLERLKGESGEIALFAGSSQTPFGLINVGDAKGLCDHVEESAIKENVSLAVKESDFSEAMFSSVKDSTSPVNLLIGSKKFIEGWDCWRVSTMGLMHVGKTEGTQIIQLFGRGVRLKGYDWSLKRSGYTFAASKPNFIEEVETLNIFGIEADFMERFRDYLKEEGLPGNEKRTVITIPLNVTYDFGKKLKMLRPKRKEDGTEYDFKKDGRVPTIGNIPDYLVKNPVVSDWYPRIQAMKSRGFDKDGNKESVKLGLEQLCFLDFDKLYFELESYKRDKTWYNLNICIDDIKTLLNDPFWYTLYLPQALLKPGSFEGMMLFQNIASALLKGYIDKYYNYCKKEYIQPRLELRELTENDDNLPDDKEYKLIVEGNEEQVIQGIKRLKEEILANKEDLLQTSSLKVCNFGRHLYQPLFHVPKGGKIKVLPVSLNESEFQFVSDLKDWCIEHQKDLENREIELFLLRNLSKGRGTGFFEAGNFHPDFILWVLKGDKQYISFIEPHGLIYEGVGSEKILFYQKIKDIEKRLNDPAVQLSSYILSWTPCWQLNWGKSQQELEEMNIIFFDQRSNEYIERLVNT